ncbi:HNH endonuclease, partial [Halobacteriales archaeon QS_7_69_60]
ADRAGEAPVRPAMLASGPVRETRPPETPLERFVYDTPLRYLVNPLGAVLLFALGGIALSFLLL